jgi:anti-sigma B factor antagonist
MDISITHETDVVRAALRGELDADTCPGLREELLTDTADAPTLVVDLSELSFVDSSGISELLQVRNAAVDRGQKFEMQNPSDTVRRVLEITGLLAHFGL